VKATKRQTKRYNQPTKRRHLFGESAKQSGVIVKMSGQATDRVADEETLSVERKRLGNRQSRFFSLVIARYIFGESDQATDQATDQAASFL
jgi:hypothetical protein